MPYQLTRAPSKWSGQVIVRLSPKVAMFFKEIVAEVAALDPELDELWKTIDGEFHDAGYPDDYNGEYDLMLRDRLTRLWQTIPEILGDA